MKLTIYLDMDGVVADFDKKFLERFGIYPRTLDAKNHKLFEEHWKIVIEERMFAHLDKFPGCDELLDFCRSVPDVSVCMLTSTSRIECHKQLQEQKLEWLDKQGIEFPAILVPGKRYKKYYADHYSILVDDTVKNVEQFIDHDGYGIVHESAAVTIKKLGGWLRNRGIEVA